MSATKWNQDMERHIEFINTEGDFRLITMPEYNTRDFRNAVSGDGSLAAEWKDKPHRLIYALCAEIERLNGYYPEVLKPKE